MRIPMSGRDMLVDVEGTPIPGGGAVLLLRDVGKEEDERRRLSRFASFVAHELRNPLAVAKARTELAQRDPTVPPRTVMHATRALESVDAAIGILERLELYSRADSGTVEATREPFELGARDLGRHRAARTRGSAPGRCAWRPPPASGSSETASSQRAGHHEPAHQREPLLDLRRADPPRGRGGDLVTLRVRDEGPGIADEVARRLFRDRVAAGRGLGLGLYLVHASMEAMGGSVSLERRRPHAIFAVRWLAAPNEGSA